MNSIDIMKLLPHRYPFLLIDKVTYADPKPPGTNWIGRKLTAIKNVTVNEPFFTGHFPNNPIMPGVLIIEAMAQAAAICAYRPSRAGLELKVFIAGIDNCRFRKPVVPGDQLEIKVEITKDRGSIFALHCESYVEGQLVTEADILAKSIFE